MRGSCSYHLKQEVICEGLNPACSNGNFHGFLWIQTSSYCSVHFSHTHNTHMHTRTQSTNTHTDNLPTHTYTIYQNANIHNLPKRKHTLCYCLYAQGPWCGATGGGSFEFRVGFQQRENFGLGLPQWEVQCHYASQHLCINLVYPPQELN